MSEGQPRPAAPHSAVFGADGRFQAIVEAAPNAMLVVDRQGAIRLVNRVAEVLFGYGHDELLGSPLGVLLPERFRDRHAVDVQRFFDAPRARAMGAGREFVARTKHGAEVVVEIALGPLETDDGPMTLASFIDVSARTRADERFRLVVEAAPIGLVMVDAAGVIVLANAQVEQLFGYARQELLGQPIETLLPARYREQHPSHRRAYLAAPSARAMGAGRDLFGRRKDGTEFPVEVGLGHVDTASGRSVMASVVDITERKRAESELRRSNAELEQFAHVASHDLQAPLRMVASYADLLAQRYRGQLDDRADNYIGHAVEGAKRMQRLVTDLLTYARIGSQRRALVPVASDKALALVLEVLADPIRDANASVAVGSLPRVLGDEVELGQLFQNLIGNALKFRSDAPPEISVRAELLDERWRFAIRDNGIGIDMQDADRAFQMLQRLHTRGPQEGSGIGLAIAKRIVERHGGRIWLESAPGRGTTVYFTLLPATDP